MFAMISSPLRSFVRMTIYFTWIFIGMPIQAVALLLRSSFAHRFPQIFHNICLKAMALRIEVRGTQLKKGPVLFVANHSSYLDISVLGALIKGAFVAKSEVATWPIYGWCAKLSRTVFVDRRARHALTQSSELKKRLQDGDSLILFPEGTSSDGNRVLPFRSSLFSAAEIEIDGAKLMVQPVTVAYTKLDGMPLGRHLRPMFTWYGDMDLFSHIWTMLGLGKPTVTVEFHPPVSIDQFRSRKEMSRYCQDRVSLGLAAALSGRPQHMPDLPALPVPRTAAALPAA